MVKDHSDSQRGALAGMLKTETSSLPVIILISSSSSSSSLYLEAIGSFLYKMLNVILLFFSELKREREREREREGGGGKLYGVNY